MKDVNIGTAVIEAKRFIEKAEAFQAEIALQKTRTMYVNAPKESGALRRASLDLTRALAEMRKPG